MRNALRQFVEWYFGVPRGTASEATQWRVQTADWFAETPTWALLLIGFIVAAGVLLVYRRDANRLSLAKRWSLIGLRLTTLGLLAVLLSQMTLAIDRVGLPLVGVLIDTSGSMRFQDDYAGTNEAAMAASLTKPDHPATRMHLAKNLLAESASGLLGRLSPRFRTRLYKLDTDGHPVRIDAASAPRQQDAVNRLNADARKSRLASALRRVIEELRTESPAAIVVVTDGISTEGESERLVTAVPFAKQANVPIYAIGVGSSTAARDIEITEVTADEIAVVDQTMVFAGAIRASGFKGRDVVLELRNAKTNKRLTARSVRVTEPKQIVELTYSPSREGEFDLKFGVVPQDEEQVSDNNYQTRHVSVRTGRIRVLLVDRLPRYEFRYIKHLLEREDSAGVFDLDTVLLDADPGWTATDRSASRLGGRVPASSQQLNQYDVVILGDVDPTLFSDSAQSALRDFVRENGGGIAFIAGPRHNPLGYRGTKLEPLFPLNLTRAKAVGFQSVLTTGVKAAPTTMGTKSTRLFRFGSDANATSRIVARFPRMRSVFQVDEVAGAGNILVSGTGDNGISDLPLIISQRYGAGTVVFHATDDLWLWRFRSGDETHGRYWLALMRYLARPSLLGRDRSAVLGTNREVYDEGESVEFVLRFRDTRKVPAQRIATVTLERSGGITETVALKAGDSDTTLYTGLLAAPSPGTWHAWASAPTFNGSPPSTDFRVQPAQRELLIRDMDREGMVAAAEATRGRFYSLGTASRLPSELPRGRATVVQRGRPIEIWSRIELLLLVAGLLATEWFLRKNARLV